MADTAKSAEGATADTATDDVLLDVVDLHAGYGPVEVLHGIDLRVLRGEVVVVLGANGAGKTTTLRAISGVVNRRGRITVDGRRIENASADSIVSMRSRMVSTDLTSDSVSRRKRIDMS